MKILQINTVYAKGSTGKIVKDLHDTCKKNGIECISAYRGGEKEKLHSMDVIEISSYLDNRIHGVLAKFTMLKGCFSYFKTSIFLKKIKTFQPDIIHLHNLHGSYINIGLLMNYIKKNNIPVVFTLHDCWAFTAICPHFMIVNCDRWQNGCGNCIQRNKYSSSPIDLTNKVWRIKRGWFMKVKNITLVTPSKWLGSMVQRSFMREYPIKIINNGIDLDIFSPSPSNFRTKYGINNKKIVLGVAFGWNYEKGLDVIIELSKRLSEEYSVVLVGTDDRVDKILPSRIISIHRTNNQKELAEIYTAADVLINPTREEVFGLVNIEALACGTPVISFNSGGSPECIDDTCGIVIEKNDIDAMERQIIRVCTEHVYSEEDCIKRANLFEKNKKIHEYIDLYNNVVR